MGIVGIKRGSVRGMPGQNWLAMSDYGEGDEAWRVAIKHGKHFAILAVAWIVIFFLICIWWAISFDPTE